MESSGARDVPGNVACTPLSGPIRLDKNVIRQIAKKQPRFAATLANLNVFGLEVGEYRVFWTPIKIAHNDIDAFIDRSGSKAFFSGLNERARRLNGLIERGSLSEITYDVSVESPDPSTRIMTMRRYGSGKSIEGEPDYSSLTIELSVDKGANSKRGGSCVVTNWRIK